jgi:hypothetical protein
MTYETAVKIAQDIRDNWKRWNDLERGAAIVLLRDTGVSHRKLAWIAGCSEGLIRNMEIVGRLPYAWKQYLLDGHSTRKVVAAWRAQRQQPAV